MEIGQRRIGQRQCGSGGGGGWGWLILSHFDGLADVNRARCCVLVTIFSTSTTTNRLYELMRYVNCGLSHIINVRKQNVRQNGGGPFSLPCALKWP